MSRRYERRMMRDMRRDGRNPYGSRGGYVTSSRGDRGNYNYDMARDYHYGNIEHYPEYDYRSNSRYADARNGRDYEHSRQYDMAYDYNYDMRSGRDRGYYDYARGRDYNYDYAGDYGETLTKDELEDWSKELMKEIDGNEKQYFTKENVIQKARQMGIKMDKFTEDELYVATLMAYTDYHEAVKPFVGSNMEIYLFMGKSFLTDEDASVKGGEKLAVYYDCIVEDD